MSGSGPIQADAGEMQKSRILLWTPYIQNNDTRILLIHVFVSPFLTWI